MLELMRKRTKELLDAFQKLDWFHAVGEPVRAKNVLSVKRWLDALGYLTSGWWEMLGYREGNAMEDAIKAAGDGMDAQWKQAVAELRPLARQIVDQKIKPIREKREWTVMLDMIADYDTSYALLEKEFKDIVKPGLFGQKAHWYLRGHLPCGMTEDEKLVVY